MQRRSHRKRTRSQQQTGQARAAPTRLVPPQAARKNGRSEQANAFQDALRQASKHLAGVRCPRRVGEFAMGSGMDSETRGKSPARHTKTEVVASRRATLARGG